MKEKERRRGIILFGEQKLNVIIYAVELCDKGAMVLLLREYYCMLGLSEGLEKWPVMNKC